MYNKLHFNSITTSTCERHGGEDKAEKERCLPLTRQRLGKLASRKMNPLPRVPVPTTNGKIVQDVKLRMKINPLISGNFLNFQWIIFLTPKRRKYLKTRKRKLLSLLSASKIPVNKRKSLKIILKKPPIQRYEENIYRKRARVERGWNRNYLPTSILNCHHKRWSKLLYELAPFQK